MQQQFVFPCALVCEWAAIIALKVMLWLNFSFQLCCYNVDTKEKSSSAKSCSQSSCHGPLRLMTPKENGEFKVSTTILNQWTQGGTERKNMLRVYASCGMDNAASLDSQVPVTQQNTSEMRSPPIKQLQV